MIASYTGYGVGAIKLINEIETAVHALYDAGETKTRGGWEARSPHDGVMVELTHVSQNARIATTSLTPFISQRGRVDLRFCIRIAILHFEYRHETKRE